MPYQKADTWRNLDFRRRFSRYLLVLRGQFTMRRGERSPGIVGLDEFLTGWMTDREWMADRSTTLIYLDSGRFDRCCQ